LHWSWSWLLAPRLSSMSTTQRLFTGSSPIPRCSVIPLTSFVSAADLDKDGFVQEAEYVAWIENEKAIEKFQKFVSAKIEHSAIENAELAKLVAESFQNLLNFF
jgi:hypothetical protein